MSEHPPLRMVNFADNPGEAQGNSAASGRNGRALSALDKVTLALVIVALLLAAAAAGTFATSPPGAVPPQDILSRLQELSLPLLGILSGVALVVAVGREWQRPVAIGPVNGLAGGGLLLGGWAGLSLLFHTPISNVNLNTLMLLFAALTLGGLISRLGRDRKALILLLLVVAGAGSLAASFGVREYLEHWKMSDSTHRVFGAFGNPNFLAGYVLLTIPLTLSLFVSARERMARLLLGLGLALQTMCLLMTGSRAAAGMLLVVLLVWFFLLARARVLQGRGKAVSLGLALLGVSALLASAPLLMRVTGTKKPAVETSVPVAGTPPAAETQEHSGKFRQYTWLGTLRMVRGNSLTGAGIGNYETVYPRYAITGYTAHAHNSFLQWMAETGVPGALFLLVVLAASTAFGTYVLFLNTPRRHAARAGKTTGRSKEQSNSYEPDADAIGNLSISRLANGTIGSRKEKEKEEEGNEANAAYEEQKENDEKEAYSLPALAFTPAPASPLPYGFDEPRLLLAGLLAAVLSTILHSLFDSDWYVVATTLTLSAVIGLIAALSRDIAPLATQTPRPLSRAMLAVCGVVGVLLLWRGTTTYLARFQAEQALEANLDFQYQAAHGDSHAADSLQSAVTDYRNAASLDPSDPDFLLMLSSLYQRQGKPDQGLQALESATHIAPTGKSFYQLGQYHKRQALKYAQSHANPKSANTSSANANPADNTKSPQTAFGAPPQDSAGNLQDNEAPIALSGTRLLPDKDGTGHTTKQEQAEANGNVKNEAKNEMSRELNEALQAFTAARERDPHSLQILRALAETEAMLGNSGEAMQTYQDMTALETTPLGTIRAIPEVIEADFAYAHARLASELNAQKQLDNALGEYQKADGLLKTYWTHRHDELYQLMNAEKRHNLNNLYASVLAGWTALLEAQGGAALESLPLVRKEQAAFQQELQADEAAEAKAQAAQNAANAAQDSAKP